MNFKITIPNSLIAATFLSFVAPAFSQEAHWLTDYAKAVEQAKTENKPILLDFTGSDWCGWCMKMKKESLDTPLFNHYAKKNLVLVEVDFPRSKPLAANVKKQNDELKRQYSANGFPTFVLVDKDAKELGRQAGYLQGGPTAFIAKLNTFYKPAPTTTKAGGMDDFDKFFKKPAETPHP